MQTFGPSLTVRFHRRSAPLLLVSPFLTYSREDSRAAASLLSTSPSACRAKVSRGHTRSRRPHSGVRKSNCLDAIAGSGGRYRGIANAGGSFTERDFEKLHEGGCRGVRFNFVKHLGGVPDTARFHRIVRLIAPLGWHVDLHFDAEGLLEHESPLRSLPVPFLVDHMGRARTAAGQEPSRSASVARIIAGMATSHVPAIGTVTGVRRAHYRKQDAITELWVGRQGAGEKERFLRGAAAHQHARNGDLSFARHGSRFAPQLYSRPSAASFSRIW